MKKQIFIAAFGLLGVFGYSQNSNPWPITGNVGIGTATPNYLLDVQYSFPSVNKTLVSQAFIGSKNTSNKRYGIRFSLGGTTTSIPNSDYFNRISSLSNGLQESHIDFNAFATANTSRAAISFSYQEGELMRINQDGKVRIGNGINDLKTAGTYKLFVEDGILTEKVKVAIKTTTDWADYVFQPDYDLMPLQEVAAFTQQNGHLPNVPSAEDMVTNGLDVAKMDAKLLEKIEELTLYAIDQDNQIDSLQTQLVKQEQEMAEMKAQLKTMMEQKQ